jgi:RNA-dependent RNA polymerase
MKTHEDQFETRRLPSVIQIRCGGIKGVLAYAPDLNGDVIHYRKSQMKFKSDHLELELIKWSQPSKIKWKYSYH